MTFRHKLALDFYVGSLFHVLLKPPTLLLGMILRRDHDLSHCSSVTILKLLGGGSLVIAYPSLLAIRNSPRIRTMRLVTTPAIRPFAEILGIFDEIIVIRETSLALLIYDSIAAVWKLFRSDAIVDLEIHSRLSTVFSLLTCARNRVGFYTSTAFWRKGLSTHLIFCNMSTGIYYFYDQIARLFGGTVPEINAFRSVFKSRFPQSKGNPCRRGARIAIAPCCSGLSRERMLAAEEWAKVLCGHRSRRLLEKSAEIHLLGAPSDRGFLHILAKLLSDAIPGVRTLNHAGDFTLAESVALLGQVDLLFCIDSALLHFGRLIGVKTISYWGPTDPARLLRPGMVAHEEVFYRKVSCSPCIHIADRPPCNGESICMKVGANLPQSASDLNPIWLVEANQLKGVKVG